MSGTTEAARGEGKAPSARTSEKTALRHDFAGKVAIVTGAAQGIGEAYARALAAAGAAVVIADISADAGQAVAKQIGADGGRAAFVRTDVGDPDSAQAMAAFAADELGGVDFLVNNAAIYGQMQFDLLLSVDWDYYKKFVGVNLDGALACTRACYQHMGAQSGRLAVMVGGSRDAYERCREPFGCWADLIMHMGPAGAGTRAKLARNLLHFASFTAAAEAQRLAEAAGVDLRKLAKVVRHSDAVTGGPGMIMLRPTTAPLDAGDPLREILENVRALGEKDLSLALQLGADLGVDLPMARLALASFAAGLGLPDTKPPGTAPPGTAPPGTAPPGTREPAR